MISKKFIVISKRFAGHQPKAIITEADLIKLGADADALIAGGHIKPAPTDKGKK